MGTFVQEDEKKVLRGDEKVEGDKFAGTRSEYLTIMLNDVFIIPADYKVYKQAIGKEGSAEYMLVNIVGSDDIRKLFPGMFDRKIRVVDENGIPTGDIVKSSGAPCDDYRQFDKIDDCVKNITGRKIKVSKVDQVRTLDYITGKTRTAPVYTFEYV